MRKMILAAVMVFAQWSQAGAAKTYEMKGDLFLNNHIEFTQDQRVLNNLDRMKSLVDWSSMNVKVTEHSLTHITLEINGTSVNMKIVGDDLVAINGHKVSLNKQQSFEQIQKQIKSALLKSNTVSQNMDPTYHLIHQLLFPEAKAIGVLGVVAIGAIVGAAVINDENNICKSYFKDNGIPYDYKLYYSGRTRPLTTEEQKAKKERVCDVNNSKYRAYREARLGKLDPRRLGTQPRSNVTTIRRQGSNTYVYNRNGQETTVYCQVAWRRAQKDCIDAKRHYEEGKPAGRAAASALKK